MESAYDISVLISKKEFEYLKQCELKLLNCNCKNEKPKDESAIIKDGKGLSQNKTLDELESGHSSGEAARYIPALENNVDHGHGSNTRISEEYNYISNGIPKAVIEENSKFVSEKPICPIKDSVLTSQIWQRSCSRRVRFRSNCNT